MKKLIMNLNELPGCEEVQFIQIHRPCFLGHDLEAVVTISTEFDLDGLVKYLIEHSGKLYIYQCVEDMNDDVTKYTLRYAAYNGKLANVLSDLKTSTTSLSSDFMPYYDITGRLHIEKLNDLQAVWGRDEVIKQLGTQVLLLAEDKFKRQLGK